MRKVDVFMMAGQSNMAGRGVICPRWPEPAPQLLEGAGYEYRAISEPGCLYSITEPFGVAENRPDGLDDGAMKTGSMVTAFVNAYYRATGVPIVAVSASKGGSCIAQWQPGTPYMTDALERWSECKAFLAECGVRMRHQYLLWCQGETDGDLGTDKATYFKGLRKTLDAFERSGVEHCFMVRVGHCNKPEDPNRYVAMMQWQDEFAAQNDDVTMVSTGFAAMRERGLMKDSFHYYQAAYNEVGENAGENAARWVQGR